MIAVRESVDSRMSPACRIAALYLCGLGARSNRVLPINSVNVSPLSLMGS